MKQVLGIGFLARPPVTAISTLIGLLTCYSLAIIHLLSASQEICGVAEFADKSNLIYVPNFLIYKNLATPGLIFHGALFVTFSLGIGLVVLTIVALYALQMLKFRLALRVFFLSACWLGLLYYLHHTNIRFWILIYSTVVPLFTSAAFSFFHRPRPKTKESYSKVFILIVTTLFYALLSQSVEDPFTATRDLLFLSNKPGEKAADFYYKHSFLPAFALASPAQRPVCFYTLSSDNGKKNPGSFENVLIKHGLFEIDDPKYSCFQVADKDGVFIFNKDSYLMPKVAQKRFLQNPATHLQHVFEAIDDYKNVREFTFWSVLAILPLMILYSVFWSYYWIFRKLLHERSKFLPGIAVVVLLLLAMPTQRLISDLAFSQEIKNPVHDLNSNSLITRWKASRTICQKKSLQVPSAILMKLANSSNASDRMFAVRMLGCLDKSNDTELLTKLLQDSNQQVVCQATRTYSKVYKDDAKEPISSIFHNANSWYLQDCSFRSFRRMR